MLDSVSELILSERRVLIEDVFEQLTMYVISTQKSVHDELAFSKFC